MDNTCDNFLPFRGTLSKVANLEELQRTWRINKNHHLCKFSKYIIYICKEFDHNISEKITNHRSQI